VKSKFKGNSLDIAPITISVIRFKEHGDKYYFTGIKTKIHNIIVGRLWIDHMGELVVQSADDENRKAVITFKECGWFSKNFRQVDAIVYDSEGRECFELSGRWNDVIYAKRLIDSKVDLDEEFNFEIDVPTAIWENTVKPVTKNNYKKWKFSRATVKTVKITDELSCTLPKSDSRFRPDRIALEAGNIKLASKEKNKLKEIQRKKRRHRDSNNLEYTPQYFVPDSIGGIDYWTHNWQKYEDERDERIRLYNEGLVEPKIEFIVDHIFEDEDKIEIVDTEIDDLHNQENNDDGPLPEIEDYYE